MNDEKRDEPEADADVEIEDLDVEEPAVETVKGGGGGDFSQKGNIKF